MAPALNNTKVVAQEGYHRSDRCCSAPVLLLFLLLLLLCGAWLVTTDYRLHRRRSYHALIVLCDVGEGFYWDGTRTAAPTAASCFLP